MGKAQQWANTHNAQCLSVKRHDERMRHRGTVVRDSGKALRGWEQLKDDATGRNRKAGGKRENRRYVVEEV